jgi:hypothetical protein
MVVPAAVTAGADEALYLIKRSMVSAAMASNPWDRGSVPGT